MKAVTGEQMRKLEQIAIEELGIPSILLMENAAFGLAKHCFRFLDKIKTPKALIVCGPGNNGGDGMALARLLHIKGIDTKVVFTGDVNKINSQTSDAGTHLAIIKKLGIQIEQDIRPDIETYDLVVDALLGTGLDRNVDGKLKNMIEVINSNAKYVISVDIPSGVHSDTGLIMGCAVKAMETVTFAHPKTGLYVYPGAEFAGKIHIEDIGIPLSLINKIETVAEVLTDGEVNALIPMRAKRTNKGDFGKVMVFAGSNEMPGAAALTCSAAYTVGCGLVCACVLPDVATVIHHWQREVITRIVPGKNGMYCKESLASLTEELNSADVIIVGPGIGRSSDVTEFVYELINIASSAEKKAPLVLDADALFAVAENTDILKKLKAPCVITPHPGEMSRLIKISVPEVLDNMINVAVKFSKEFNVVTLLKDANTIIANPNGRFNINTTGNSALSKAGTGDVLAGFIAGFIAQGRSFKNLDVFTASILGAYFHGKAGEAAAMNKPSYSVTASDLFEHYD